MQKNSLSDNLLAITKSKVDFGPVSSDDYPYIEIYGWSPDGKNIVFFFTKLYWINKIWGDYDHGYFYSLDIKTGAISKFSGVHEVVDVDISPSVTSP